MVRRVLTNETGSGIVLMVLLMAIVIGIMALALDGSSAMAARRQAQNAADAAAVAGVRALSSDGVGPTVPEAILEYVERNEVGLGDWSYMGDLGDTVGVVVTTTATVPTFFARSFGTEAFTVIASAEARRMQEWVFFANNANTDQALEIDGSNLILKGSVHSNGGLVIDGNSNQIVNGRVESVRKLLINGNNNLLDLNHALEITESGGFDVIGGGNQYPSPSYTAGLDRMPRYELGRSLGSYGPTRPSWVPAVDYHYYSGSQAFSGSGQVLTGVYYVDGDLVVDGTNQRGTVTFVATGDVILDGSLQDFTAYDGQVVIYANGDALVIGNNSDLKGVVYGGGNLLIDGNSNAILPHDYQPVLFAARGDLQVAGNSQSVSGVAYAPYGAATIDGNSLALPFAGGVVADTIRITGNNASIRYDSTFAAKDMNGSTIRLVD